MDYFHVEGDTKFALFLLDMRFRWGFSGGVDNDGEAFLLGGRWVYSDEPVRMVRGYGLHFAKNFWLLNTRIFLPVITNGAFELLCDLARLADAKTSDARTLVGYGIGVRYWLQWFDWLEGTMLRIHYGVPKEGIKHGFLYAGLGWEF